MSNDQAKRNYTSVGGNSAERNDNWEVKTDPSIPRSKEGYYVGKKELVGPMGSFNVHVFDELVNNSIGDRFEITGGKVLDDKLNSCQMNVLTYIEYKGKVKVKGTGLFSYHNWEVGQDYTAPSLKEMLEKQSSKDGLTVNKGEFKPESIVDAKKPSAAPGKVTVESLEKLAENPFSDDEINFS